MEPEILGLYVGDPRLIRRQIPPDPTRSIKEKNQLETELRLLKSGRKCTIDAITPDVARTIRYHGDRSVIKDLLEEKFYQPDVMKVLLCAAGSVVHLPSSAEHEEQNENIRHWFRRLEKLSVGKSAYGDTYLGYIGKEGNAPPFVLKVPKTEMASQEAAHEIVVGMYGLNQLRKLVPNFSYVFGGFSCSAPIPSISGKEVGEWCKVDGKMIYSMYENVSNSVSLNRFFSNCSGEEFVNVTLQLCYALNTAHKTCDFTHYDLHGGNILVRKLNHPVQLVYETDRGKEYITTSYIPMIIDYGFSHIVYQGRHYGHYFIGDAGGMDLGLSPNRSYPFHDTFKLIVSILMSGNPRILEIANRLIIPYVFRGDVNRFLKEQAKFTFEIPSGFERLNYLYLPSMLRKHVWGFVSRSPNRFPIWNCGEKACPSPVQILDSLIPKDIDVDFYEVRELMKEGRGDEVLPKLASRFDEKFDEYQRDTEELRINYNNAIKKYVRIKIEGDDLETFTKKLPQISEMMFVINDVFDRLHRIIYYSELVDEIAVALKREDIRPIIQMNIKVIRGAFASMLPIVKDLKRLAGEMKVYYDAAKRVNHPLANDIMSILMQNDVTIRSLTTSIQRFKDKRLF